MLARETAALQGSTSSGAGRLRAGAALPREYVATEEDAEDAEVAGPNLLGSVGRPRQS